jgi:predicted Zn-dependent protease
MGAVLCMAFCFAPSGAGAQGARPAIVTIRDAETESLVRAIVAPLAAAAGVDTRLIRVTIIRDRRINAFVAQGNRMFFHTGLMLQAETLAEFAGVVAHEVGHISGGHLARLPEEMRNAMLRSVAAMLLGGLAGAAAGSPDLALGAIAGGQAMAMGEFFAFSRAQEQAADAAAILYLDRLGWTPRGLERLLQRLLEQELLAVARQDPYFQTHPLSRDRLEYVRDQIARSRFADAPMPAALELRYQMVRGKLAAFIEGPAGVARRFPREDASPPARYARAIVAFRSGRVDEALRGIEALIRESPGSPWLHELRGQVLFESGRVVEAVAPYREAARLAPGEGLIRLNHARALIEVGNEASLRAAVAELRAALETERESSFAWRLLGTAWGRLGNQGEADLAMAEEAVLRGEYPDARFLAARAERALPPGPSRLRATDLRQSLRRDNLTPEQRQMEDEMRRRAPR